MLGCHILSIEWHAVLIPEELVETRGGPAILCRFVRVATIATVATTAAACCCRWTGQLCFGAIYPYRGQKCTGDWLLLLLLPGKGIEAVLTRL